MDWFNRTLYRVGEIGGYVVTGGLGVDAVRHAVQGEPELAVLEGTVSLYVGFSSYSAGQRRKAIENFEKFSEDSSERAEDIRKGPLAELNKSIDALGNKNNK